MKNKHALTKVAECIKSIFYYKRMYRCLRLGRGIREMGTAMMFFVNGKQVTTHPTGR